MDKILDIFSTSYLATVFVVLLHGGVGFYFLVTDIHTPEYGGYVEAEEEELVEIMTEDDLETPQVQENIDAKESDINPEDIKALSSDVNDSREESKTDYSQYISPSMGKTAEESVQDMIDEIKNDLDAQNKDYDTGLGEEKDYKIGKIKDDKNGGDGKTKKAGKTMADYDFSSPSRTARNKRGLKIPGYTGKGSGVIYVKVTINQIGYVVGTPSIDYSKTTMKEPYALKQAIEYAKKERFVRDPKAPKKQEGYFIYTYVAQ